jgi:hypothetical protein
MSKVAEATSLPTSSSPELGDENTVASSANRPFPPNCSVCGERLVAAPAELHPMTFCCPNDPTIAIMLRWSRSR